MSKCLSAIYRLFYTHDVLEHLFQDVFKLSFLNIGEFPSSSWSRSLPSEGRKLLSCVGILRPPSPHLSFMRPVSNCFFPNAHPARPPLAGLCLLKAESPRWITGSAEQRSPWESRHLFLCLFKCSFKDQVLKSRAHQQQQILLAGETCHLF